MTQDYITKCNYFLKVVVYIGNYEYRNKIQLSKWTIHDFFIVLLIIAIIKQKIWNDLLLLAYTNK